MFGSLFYNFWAALFSFAAYFIVAIQNPYAMPFQTILTSFAAAAIAFVIMFAVRYFLGYVFYTPEAPVFAEAEQDQLASVQREGSHQQFAPQKDRTTMEFGEENTEDAAKAVRTMLHSDEALSR